MTDAPEMAMVSIRGLSALVEEGGHPVNGILWSWLGPAERQTYGALRVAKRRRDWLAGRIAAKDLIRGRHDLPGPDSFLHIEIAAVREGPERGRPFYRLHGKAGPYCLSLSHSGDHAVAALCRRRDQLLGVDHEEITPREPSFEALALSAEELRRLGTLRGEARSVFVTRCWVLKEALLKALGTGLRLPLPALTVDLDPRTGDLAEPPFSAGPEVPTLKNHLTCARTIARLFALGDRIGAWVVHHPSEQT